VNVKMLIPWWERSSELRFRNRRLVLDFYQDQLPEWRPTIWSDTFLQFSKAKTVNRIMHPDYSDVDVIVLNDADSLCPADQIREAIRLAFEQPGLVFAYTSYCRLDQRTTEGLSHWSQAFEAPVEREIEDSGSQGCAAISRRCFLELGGYDERYVGWGYEDLEFARRANLRWRNRRVEGDLTHLWHGDRRQDDSPLDADPAATVRNLDLYRGQT
jgi:hypothetical protein